MMGPIEEALREKIFPSLFGGEEITADFRKILGHSVKHRGLGIPDPRMSADSAYNISKADSRELVYSLLGGSVLNYIGHRACVCKASQSPRLSKGLSSSPSSLNYRSRQETRRKTASVGQRGMRHGLVLYLIALMTQSCLGRTSGIIFASDMG